LYLVVESLNVVAEFLIFVDRLFAVEDCHSPVAEGLPNIHRVMERQSFAASVADAFVKRQGEVVIRQRLMRLAQVAID
jgi:hypothetical protein